MASPQSIDDLTPRDNRACRQLFGIIFGHQTRAGKAFDVALIIVIILSVIAVMLDSVTSFHRDYGGLLLRLEWIFTIAFTAEYVIRAAIVRQPLRYLVSFYGLVDLLSILPTYISLLFPGASSLLVIRAMRIVRVFRILKLVRYVGEANLLLAALRASRRKILVFLTTVLTLVIVFGALMYMIEGPEHGYTSIPRGMYWAIVTLTTVGYGDISPSTSGGQFIASIIMVLGYGIIAVPTGIYTAELSDKMRMQHDKRRCPSCELKGHIVDAVYCRRCGNELEKHSQ